VRNKCILEWSTVQGRVGACVVVKDTGKENADPNATPMLARRPRMKKVVSELEAVAHCTQMPSTRSKTRLKRQRKQEQLQACAEGGHDAPHTEDSQVENGSHGVRWRLADAADAHAGDRGGKRIRTSASRYNASAPTLEPLSHYALPFCILYHVLPESVIKLLMCCHCAL
jgi:hypothetical protein